MRKYVGLLILALLLVVCGCALADVTISDETFPDSIFQTMVRSDYDTNGDGILSNGEIAEVTEINIRGSGMDSLEGIKYFTSLRRVEIYNCSYLTGLDLSGSSTLDYVAVDSCAKITAINLSGCSALTEFRCSGNDRLISLDFSGCTAVKQLSIYSSNELKTINMTGCAALERFYSYGEKLTSLILTGCTSLKTFSCGGSASLTSLILTGFTKLENISINSCANLSFLELGGCSALRSIYIWSCGLNSLDLKDCRALTSLWVDTCKLEELDLTGLSKMEYLSCRENKLSKIDLSPCSALQWLDVANNRLSTLDLSKNTRLYAAHCYLNRLTSLKIGKGLVGLDCRYNRLTSLNISPSQILRKLVERKPRRYMNDPEGSYVAYEDDEEYRFLYLDPSVKISGASVSQDVKVKKGKYRISGTTATFLGATSKTLTSLVIPDTIKVDGTTYKVTAIADGACKDMKKLKTLTIGKNVKTIGAKAFYNCKKLAKIIVNCKKLTKVGANAFKNILKTATFLCPAKQLNSYKKLLKKGNPPSKVKYKKQ